MRVGFVGENVLAGVGHSSGVEVGVGKMELLRFGFGEKTLVVVQGVIDARNIEIFCLLGWDLKVERSKWSDFRNELQKECQNSSADTRTPVSLTPFPLIVGAR